MTILIEKIETAIRAGNVTLDEFHSVNIPEKNLPEGWLSGGEMQILYTLARECDGPVLEIGSWLGRSTVCLAAGIKDSGNKKKFDVVDFGITSPNEWEKLLKEDFIRFAKDDVVARSIFQPGGSIALLIDNLRKAELLDYTTSIIRGDSTEVPLRSEYNVIFCDTLHDEREIIEYGVFLDGLLKPGGWLICDDILDEQLGSKLREYIGFDCWFYSNPLDQYSKFFIGRKKS